MIYINPLRGFKSIGSFGSEYLRSSGSSGRVFDLEPSLWARFDLTSSPPFGHEHMQQKLGDRAPKRLDLRMIDLRGCLGRDF